MARADPLSSRRASPQRIKKHYSYTVGELANLVGVHRNTVRAWQRDGLQPVDRTRPLLFHGEAVRAFLTARHTNRKQPCQPGTLYCFRCRVPRKPALGMVDYVALKPTNGNLSALCEVCESTMHRRVREADIASVMPGCTVQFTQCPSSLIGKPRPSLNCDLKGAH